MPIDQRDLQDRLTELCTKYDVAGATLAVLADGELTTAATGVLNRDTGVEATTDSLFQIGSITKLYTTALVSRLVERGLLELDAPLVTYLPEFRVADAEVSRSVTIRDLLTHTSGIDGDHFLDTGRGDDVLERYTASCAELTQVHPRGASWSYCNAGFNVLGRLLEVVTGNVWDQVLRDELVTPLGLESTWTLPEEVLRFRAACGHVGAPGALHITPQWGIPRSAGPAGLINATASDLVRFAQVVLADGKAADGSVYVTPETVASWLAEEAELPDPYTLGRYWGLGWILFDWDGHRVVGHDGSTLGQAAFMRVVPDSGVVVALLTNGGGARDLYDALYAELLRDTCGITIPERISPVDGASGGDRASQVGRYWRASATIDVEALGDAGLRLTITNTSELAHLLDDPTTVVDLLPVREDTYVGRLPTAEGWVPVVFFSLPDGTRYVHLGARANRKIS